MMPVKFGGRGVLCIDQECKHRDFRAQGTCRGIHQQRAAEAASFECRIHRKAADTRGGNGRIPGQTPPDILRKIIQ